MWGMMDSQGGKKATNSEGFVQEGNIEIYLMTDKETRVRFLTEAIDVEFLMHERKQTREEVEEYIRTELLMEKWLFPVSHWEHTIPQIPNVRYFSTIACLGRKSCQLCDENDKARANGVTENKQLPYPVRKRFLVPAYFYEMDRILFVKQGQEFFEDIATYVDKNPGQALDFGIYKTGRGLSTKYKSVFLGPSQKIKKKLTVGVAPKDLDFSSMYDDLDMKLGGRSAQKPSPSTYTPPVAQTPVPAQQGQGQAQGAPAPATPAQVLDQALAQPPVAPPVAPPPRNEAGDFVIPFGSHKGKTIREIYIIDQQYVDFLKENSSGLLQDKVAEFLKSEI